MRQWSINVERLLRCGALFRLWHVLQGAHIVQAIGQLDENDPNVLGHRHDHLAEALRLAFLTAGKFQLAELSHPFHQDGHVVAKALRHLLGCDPCILDSIVEQRTRNGHCVHF